MSRSPVGHESRSLDGDRSLRARNAEHDNAADKEMAGQSAVLKPPLVSGGRGGQPTPEPGSEPGDSHSHIARLEADLARLTFERDEAITERNMLLGALNSISPSLLNTPKRDAAGRETLPVKKAIALALGDVQIWLDSHSEQETALENAEAQLQAIQTSIPVLIATIEGWIVKSRFADTSIRKSELRDLQVQLTKWLPQETTP